MTKKELLIHILEKLMPYWKLAEGFLVLINRSNDENFIDQLYHLISKGIHSVEDTKKRNRIKEQLQKIKIRSNRHALKDTEDAERMLNQLIYDD